MGHNDDFLDKIDRDIEEFNREMKSPRPQIIAVCGIDFYIVNRDLSKDYPQVYNMSSTKFPIFVVKGWKAEKNPKGEYYTIESDESVIAVHKVDRFIINRREP